MPLAQQALDRLLAEFVRHDNDAALEFRRVAPPIIRGLARRFGPDLPADVIDEVVSETYLLLLGHAGAAFEARRGSAQKFLFGIVANAVKRVRASYRAAASPTRPRKTSADSEQAVVPFDESQHGLGQRLLPDAQQVDAAADIALLLTGMTAPLAIAIVAVHVDGHTVSRVARILGVSRFKIRRAMRQIQVRSGSRTPTQQRYSPQAVPTARVVRS
jgi:DNA-directed RNA polymerase specialized sigma24 family protein